MLALETVFGSILVAFLGPKSFQNQPQERPKRHQNSWSFLEAVQNLKKITLSSTWGQNRPNLALKLAPSWAQNGIKICPKTASEAKSAPEPILGRLWADFGLIFGRFLSWLEHHFGYIFDHSSAWALALGLLRLGFSSWALALGL